MATVVVIASPIPTHPSDWILKSTLDSVREHLPLRAIKEIIISNDGIPRGVSRSQVEAYRQYLDKVSKYEFSKPLRCVTHQRHLHISGQLEAIIPLVSTPFVLVMQHDLAFSAAISLDTLLDVMSVNSEIKHVRFNRRANMPMGWDASHKSLVGLVDRTPFFKEEVFQGRSATLSLIRTLSWSDNNFLTSKEYLSKVVIPMTKGFRFSPEQAINPVNSVETHGVFGTFIYGGLDQNAVLAHLDGRLSGTIPNRIASRLLRLRIWKRPIKRLRKIIGRQKRRFLSARYEIIGRVRLRKVVSGY